MWIRNERDKLPRYPCYCWIRVHGAKRSRLAFYAYYDGAFYEPVRGIRVEGVTYFEELKKPSPIIYKDHA